MRAILCCFLATVALNSAVMADDKKEEKLDATKLVGKWKAIEKKGEHPLTIDFRKDGKMTARLTIKEETYSLPFSYRIDGGKVVLVMKENVEHDQVYVIDKLTDTEMVWTSEKYKEKQTFTRLKDK